MTEEATKKAGRPPAIKPKPVETPPVETVNTGHEEKPLVDDKPKPEQAKKGDKKCPDHPKAKAVLYGMCTACYNKLTKAKKRGLYLKARLTGNNTHSYPIEMRRAWKKELAMIEAGTWLRPIKIKRKTNLAG